MSPAACRAANRTDGGLPRPSEKRILEKYMLLSLNSRLIGLLASCNGELRLQGLSISCTEE